jgi:hypothetical protein
MFYFTMTGYAINTIYSDTNDVSKNEKTINRIIDLFK